MKTYLRLIAILLLYFIPTNVFTQTLDWESINFSNAEIVTGKINGFNMGGYSYGRMNTQSDLITTPQECNQCVVSSIFCNQVTNQVTGTAFSSMQTNPEVVTQSIKLKPSVLRFPGGTHSGWYHFYEYDNSGLYDASAPVIDKGYGMSLIESSHLNNPLSYCILDSRLTVDQNYIDGFINYINNIQVNPESPKVAVSYVANLLTHFRFPATQSFCTSCGREKALIPMDNYDCSQTFNYSYEGNEALFNDDLKIYRFELYYKETQDAISRIVENLDLEANDILYVEMGNEYYGAAGYPFSKYQITVDDYAKLVEIYSERLKCYFSGLVDIKVGVVTTPNSPWHNGLINRLNDDQSNDGTTLDQEVDAVIYHQYYSEDTCLDDINIETRFACAKDAFRNHIEVELPSQLNILSTDFPNQDIWLTEWNMLRGADNKNNSYLNTILHASFVQEYALNLLQYNTNDMNNVTMATHHRIGDHNIWSVIQTQEGDNSAAFFRGGAYAMQDISKLYEYDNIHFIGNLLTDGNSIFDTKEAKTTVFYQAADATNTKDRLLVYFSNKTASDIDLNIPDIIDDKNISSIKTSYVKGNHLFSYGPSNTTAGRNRFKASNNNEYFNEELNTLGFGDLHDQFIAVKDSLLSDAPSKVLPPNSVGVVEIEFASLIDYVEEINTKKLKVNIYPNPALAFFNVDIYSDSSQNLTIELIDPFGKSILNTKESISQGTQTLKLETNNVSNGFYFLVIRGSKALISKKILVYQ